MCRTLSFTHQASRNGALVFLLVLSGATIRADPPKEEGLIFHKAPKSLAEKAVTESWPRFLGAADAPVSRETGLVTEFSGSGPPLVWECRKGEGYASPAIVDGKLLLFHRMNGNERLDCLEAETGQRLWRHEYPVEYQDDYGYSNGPRAGPVVAGGKVVTFGVTSVLKCCELGTGKVIWEHDCAAKFGVPQYFFGSGASPLVHDGLVIVNLGGSDQRCVCAFELTTGALKWTAKHEWGQSYASPVAVTLRGKERVIVFAGGKSQPSTGGVLSLDPLNGVADDTFFWRARRYPSVNAATPVLCGPNRIFVSQAYVDRDCPCHGGVMLRMDDQRKFTAEWKAPDFGCHWTTPVFHYGHLYGFSGEKDRECRLVCYDAASGAQKWSEQFQWTQKGAAGSDLPMSLYRGSLLHVQGKFLCLGEWGTLAWLDLSPAGAKLLSRCQPFVATQSWTLPALSRGLLYVSQNESDRVTNTPARLLCFDLRRSP